MSSSGNQVVGGGGQSTWLLVKIVFPLPSHVPWLIWGQVLAGAWAAKWPRHVFRSTHPPSGKVVRHHISCGASAVCTSWLLCVLARILFVAGRLAHAGRNFVFAELGSSAAHPETRGLLLPCPSGPPTMWRHRLGCAARWGTIEWHSHHHCHRDRRYKVGSGLC